MKRSQEGIVTKSVELEVEDVGGNSPSGDTTHEKKGNDLTNLSKDNCNNYTTIIPICNILLVGLSYNRSIMEQFVNDDSFTNISMCVDDKGRQIETSVARDTYRCMMLEKAYSNVKVFTVNKCTDALRACENETDLNNISCDVCSRRFTSLLKTKAWTFHEVYVDTVRMQKTYVADNFGKNFFVNLCAMAKEGMLVNTMDTRGKVYLPFNPHFFVHVHTASTNITSNYDISYIRESEIDASNHKLAYSSNNNDNFASMHKSMVEEDRHITTNKAEILNYYNGYLMTKATCEELLAPLGNIEELRYIVLTCNSSSLNINTPVTDYSCDLNIYCTKKCNICMLSKVGRCGSSEYLVFLGRKLLYKLVTSELDTKDGISIVADAPECNKNARLNIERPGVLRQYYGMNIAKIDTNTIKRVAYRSHSSTCSEGSDPNKLVIKPFTYEISAMALYLHKFLGINENRLDLNGVDITHPFNSCSVLMYHTLANFKLESHMGWHRDSKFSVAGKFKKKGNDQMYNTPVVIFTIGNKRLLHWRKRWTKMNENGYKSYSVDPHSMMEMMLYEGSFCLVNPKDEEPHIEKGCEHDVHLQHGKVKLKDDSVSVAFVFRVSPHTCICNLETNHVILEEDALVAIKKKELTSSVKDKHRQKLYKQLKRKVYHKELNKKFTKVFGI